MKKRMNLTTVLFTVAVLIGVSVLLVMGSANAKVSVNDNSVDIKGMYGVTVQFSDIEKIELIEKTMSEIGTGRRTNGYGGLGQSLKGHFKSDTNGEMLLFVQSRTAPTILIERTDGKDIYISFTDGEATRKLYDNITLALNNIG